MRVRKQQAVDNFVFGIVSAVILVSQNYAKGILMVVRSRLRSCGYHLHFIRSISICTGGGAV